MSLKTIFEGQAIKSEMVVLILEKWGLHPAMEEKAVTPNLDDLARDTRVVIPRANTSKRRKSSLAKAKLNAPGF